MKRAGIFLFYDPQGLVDDYIVECLTSLREYLDEILVVSNSPLDDTARERLLKGATEVFERENTGFDVGGYRDGIARFGWDRLGQIDELIHQPVEEPLRPRGGRRGGRLLGHHRT